MCGKNCFHKVSLFLLWLTGFLKTSLSGTLHQRVRVGPFKIHEIMREIWYECGTSCTNTQTEVLCMVHGHITRLWKKVCPTVCLCFTKYPGGDQLFNSPLTNCSYKNRLIILRTNIRGLQTVVLHNDVGFSPDTPNTSPHSVVVRWGQTSLKCELRWCAPCEGRAVRRLPTRGSGWQQLAPCINCTKHFMLL